MVHLVTRMCVSEGYARAEQTMYRVTRPPQAIVSCRRWMWKGGCPTSNFSSHRLWESGGCPSLCKVRDTFPLFFPKRHTFLPDETALNYPPLWVERKVFYIFIFFRIAGHAGTSIKGKSWRGWMKTLVTPTLERGIGKLSTSSSSGFVGERIKHKNYFRQRPDAAKFKEEVINLKHLWSVWKDEFYKFKQVCVFPPCWKIYYVEVFHYIKYAIYFI